MVLSMRKLQNVVAVLLVAGLLLGSVPVGALASASSPAPAEYDVVLPAGELMDDEELAEVTGEAWHIVVGAVGGYILTKLADAVWDRYVDPWLEETVFPWIEDKFSGGSKDKD
ncbi:MAG: hypothetical protein DIU83_04225 [Bacillota bacterium]|nr:MAG: hypothetical protein DIU83_04225 [Bacillota bacterium]